MIIKVLMNSKNSISIKQKFTFFCNFYIFLARF